MSQRRFLIASALARLIRKEQGVAGRSVEGYFPARSDREHFVSLEPGHSYLVLAPAKEGAGEEERTEVPRSQAAALLPICAGSGAVRPRSDRSCHRNQTSRVGGHMWCWRSMRRTSACSS